MATATTTAPVFQTRHRRLDTSVWQNENDGRTFYNTKLRRSYKDGEQWKSTAATFNREHLLPAAKLLEWADGAIGQAVQKNAKADSEDHPLIFNQRGRLEVAIWQRNGEKGTYYRVSLKRSFKDGDDWKETKVWLGGEECLPAARLLVRTFDGIDQLAAESAGSFVAAAKEQFGATEVGAPDEEIPF